MKKLISLMLALLLCTALLLPVFADQANPLIVDGDGLLTAQQLASLEARAEELSQKTGCSICILTVPTFNGMEGQRYAESCARSLTGNAANNYLLLVVSGSEHHYGFTSGGLGDECLSRGDTEQTLDQDLRIWLGSGNYAEAFANYLDRCASLLQASASGKTTRLILGIVLALALGFLLSMIPLAIMKRTLNNVSKNAAAANYVREGSLELRVNEDRYLRTDVNRVRVVAPQSSSGGGDAGRTGSSGHAGGGGTF